jgi:hypothetical protein
MLRVTELALFLAPFAAFAVWRLTSAQGGPSLGLLAAACCGLALLAGGLIWWTAQDRVGARDVYVPAHIEEGRVIPGHVARP